MKYDILLAGVGGQGVLSIAADVRLMEPGSIERSQGKGKHVIDNRNLK